MWSDTQRASSAYFCHLMVAGLYGPYLSPVLLEAGYSHAHIGLWMAALSLASAFAPYLVVHLSVRDSATKLLARRCAMFGLMLSMMLALWPQRPLLPLCMVALACVRAPMGALLDSVAMRAASDMAGGYALIRMWGSAGWVAAACGGGFLLAGAPRSVFFLVLVVLSGIALASTWVLPKVPAGAGDLTPEEPGALSRDMSHDPSGKKSGGVTAVVSSSPRPAADSSLWHHLDRPFCLWLAAMMLHWFAFAPYQYGFSLYLQEAGVSQAHSGLIWSIGVVAEMVAFACASRVFACLTVTRVLLVALSSSALRWMLLALAPTLPVITISQLLHGPGFALYYAAAMHMLSVQAGPRHRLQFQGLFATLIGGVAACSGTAVAGLLHNSLPFRSVFLLMVPIEVIAIVIFMRSRSATSHPIGMTTAADLF